MRRTLSTILLAAVLLVGGMAQPAWADWQQWFGLNCGGNEVSLCAWLDWDPQRGLIRANGNARDEIGGGNYSVAVNDTMVQVLPFAQPWTTIGGTAVGDWDGWHAVWDASTSGVAGYWCGFQYRALTYHRWIGPSNGGQWIASDPVVFC